MMHTSSAQYCKLFQYICSALHPPPCLPSKFILQVLREEGLRLVVTDTVEAVYQTLTVYHWKMHSGSKLEYQGKNMHQF